ncbi:MAG: amidohydrolase [Polyangiales bacterium]
MPCFHVDKDAKITPHPASGKGHERADIHDRIDEIAKKLQPKVVEWRHDIHKNPELSNREFRTAKIVADHLKSLKLDSVKTDIAPTGVVGILKGGKPGNKVIALRADMDALPVEEKADVPFKSTVIDKDYPDGPFPVAHVCGHDAHTTMLMGAAEVLAELRDEIPGTVMFVFQPAEEGPPLGEPFGAEAMLKAGIFDDPKPDACFCMHTTTLPVNTLAYGDPTMTAASTLFTIKIQGKQVHGSMPWLGLDTMPVLAAITNGFAQIYRQVPATDAVTLSIGKVDTVGRSNIVGDHTVVQGTMRAVKDDIMENIEKRMARIVEHAAAMHGLTATIEFEQQVPSSVNTKDWIEKLTPSLERVAGPGNLHVVPPMMAYDDASRFVQAAGGMYICIGVQDVKFGPHGIEGNMVPNHNEKYYVLDESMELGVRTHAYVTMDFLGAN